MDNHLLTWHDKVLLSPITMKMCDIQYKCNISNDNIIMYKLYPDSDECEL